MLQDARSRRGRDRPRLLVIGAGTAGIPAALAGVAHGSDVVVVEKTSRLGGMLWASGAVLSGASSQLQRAKGIVDSPAAHEQEVWEVGRRRADRRLLRMATEEAGPTIDWLVSLGVRFEAAAPTRVGLADEHELYRVPRSYVLDAPPELRPYRGPVLAKVLEDRLLAEVAAGHLTLRLSCEARRLVIDDKGSVNGCVVRDADGETAVAADAVVLATGGYAANQRLLQRFHGQFDRIISQGLDHATGDGLVMAEEVGAVLANEDLVVPMLGAVEDPNRPGFRLSDTMMQIGRPPAEAGDIWVNGDGKRFLAEDDGSPDRCERAVLAQSGRRMYVVFDDVMRRGLTPAVGSWTSSHFGDPPDADLVRSASSIAELAGLMGVPSPNLVATVEEFNRAVRTGHDQALGRAVLAKALDTPPYYAVPTASSILVTFAGIRVNDRLQVLRRDGRPIEGLFAAGELIGGGQVQGDGFSSGMSVTPAIAFGRLAAGFALGVR